MLNVSFCLTSRVLRGVAHYQFSNYNVRKCCSAVFSVSITHGYRSFKAIFSLPKSGVFGRKNINSYSTVAHYLDCSDPDTEKIISGSFTVHEEFISPEEEDSLFKEIAPYLRKLRYEKDHWDDAIHGYRETERKTWNDRNQQILRRVQDLAFPPETTTLAHIHVLDLEKTGYIKAHIDSVRFCGDTIAGLCLLSPSVMRVVHDKDKEKRADILLNQRSLYIMKGPARFDFTHEVLEEKSSVFKGRVIPRDRRISVICRNEPQPQDTKDC